MSHRTESNGQEWISPQEAARRLEVDRGVIHRMIARGQLTVRQLPGARPRVLAAEVEQVGRHAITPARTPAAECSRLSPPGPGPAAASPGRAGRTG